MMCTIVRRKPGARAPKSRTRGVCTASAPRMPTSSSSAACFAKASKPISPSATTQSRTVGPRSRRYHRPRAPRRAPRDRIASSSPGARATPPNARNPSRPRAVFIATTPPAIGTKISARSRSNNGSVSPRARTTVCYTPSEASSTVDGPVARSPITFASARGKSSRPCPTSGVAPPPCASKFSRVRRPIFLYF